VTTHVPADIPVTIPEDEPTEAIVGHAQDQVPPVVALDNAVVNPVQTNKLPVVGVERENTFTVIATRVLGHPATS
jgi:hypothetical protein